MMKKKKRLVVQKGNENVALKVEEIAFVFREDTIVFAVDKEEKKYICNQTLSQLERELDPQTFFRANRKYLINIQYLKGFKSFDKVKLELHLTVGHEHHIIVSQETAPFFKRWLVEER